MEIILRPTLHEDLVEILALYTDVAKNERGIARSVSEIDMNYVEHIWSGIQNNGLGYVAIHDNKVIGEIHANQKGIKIFDHLLSYLTVGVHPNFQGLGIGRKLFTSFLDHVKNKRQDIYRVELESRASNKAGISLYEGMGFVLEGRMKNQTRNADGSHEDGVMYAWINPNYESLR